MPDKVKHTGSEWWKMKKSSHGELTYAYLDRIDISCGIIGSETVGEAGTNMRLRDPQYGT